MAYGKVVQAMALLKQAGAEQVGLLTDSQNDKSRGKHDQYSQLP